MGGATSTQSSNSELPKGKVDPAMVGAWTHQDETSQSRLELNIDGSYFYVLRGFDEKLIKTTKQRGEWGRFSRYVVLKGQSLYFGFACGSGAAGWMEFVGSTQLEIHIGLGLILYGGEEEPDKTFTRTENRQPRFCSDFGTTNPADGVCTTVFISRDGTFKLSETSTANIETHFKGEWFPYFNPTRGILLHASHSKRGEAFDPRKIPDTGKRKSIRVDLSDDSDSEDLPPPRETEVNQIWAVWVDQVNSSQFRLVKSPQLQLVHTQVQKEEQEKKEFYLPGKGKAIKPPLVQEGCVLYSLHEKNNITLPPKPVLQQSRKSPKIELNPIPAFNNKALINGPKPIVVTSPPSTPNYQPYKPKPIPTPPPKQEADYSQQLLTLADMGFTDTELNKTILGYTGGNLSDTVEQIMASLQFD